MTYLPYMLVNKLWFDQFIGRGLNFNTHLKIKLATLISQSGILFNFSQIGIPVFGRLIKISHQH